MSYSLYKDIMNQTLQENEELKRENRELKAKLGSYDGLILDKIDDIHRNTVSKNQACLNSIERENADNQRA